jgi:hypothetical protein
LYNQIVGVTTIQQKNTLEDNTRIFAFATYAMVDAGIALWKCEYYYHSLWCLTVSICHGSDYTQADPNWLILGVPADSAGSTNFTDFSKYYEN